MMKAIYYQQSVTRRNKDHWARAGPGGRAGHSQARVGMSERDSQTRKKKGKDLEREGRNLKRREGVRGLTEAGRAESQAEIKAGRETEKTRYSGYA